MSSESPFISVVMPVFNGSAFLDDAVATIAGQRLQPDEVVVVDDGSSDDTAERVAALGPPFRLVRQENQGPAGARNRGLREVRGELVAFLDVDDLWPSDKLAVQARLLAEQPDTEVVQGQVRIEPAPDERLAERLLRPHFRVNLGAGLYRRRVFARVGELDASMRTGEDLDWFLRAREAGARIRWLKHVTLIYRRHAGNVTRDCDTGQLGLFQVMKRSLERRRAKGGGQPTRLDPIRRQERPSDLGLGGPRVSVIMPAYNAARFIEQALASIRAQTRPPAEIIVVDDGSTDDTTELVRNVPGVTLLQQTHTGIAGARNRGLQAATGDIIAWLDADDLWAPEALAYQLESLGGEQRADIVMGRVREFQDAGHSDLERLAREAGPARAAEVPGVIAARREVYERVGSLSAGYRAGAFMDWLLRARQAGEVERRHEHTLLYRRLHDANLSRREPGTRRDYLRLVKAQLDRRRRATGEAGSDD